MASMHNTIAQAVKTAIDAMASPPRATVVRKEFFDLDTDTLPLCIVSEEGDYRDGDHYQGGILREYDIRVTYLRSGKMELQTDVEDNPDMIRLIYDALDGTTLSGVSEVWNVEFPPTSGFKTGSVSSGVDQSMLIVTYHANEA